LKFLIVQRPINATEPDRLPSTHVPAPLDAAVTRPVAVLDANVLYGIVVTDLLITLAIHGVYRPHWT